MTKRTYKDEVEVSQLIEDDRLASRDATPTEYSGNGQFHVLVLFEETVVRSDSGGNWFNP